MLPPVKRTLAAAATALAVALVPAAPAAALGKNERNFLKGVAATLIVGALIRNARAEPAPVVAPAPHPGPTPAPQPGASLYRTPAAVAFARLSPSERRQVQQRLAAWGYYRGAIDGAYGPRTHAAVAAYARDARAEAALGTLEGAFALYGGLAG
jgi:hypothetical protein